MPYRVLDFFAGAGGLSEGLRIAGLDVLYANEIDRWAKMTYERNHPETIFRCCDIADVTPDSIYNDIHNAFELDLNDIDIMVGGPPCQGFSIIGQRNIDDPRNRLFREFLRLVQQIQPKAFIMENVFGLLSMQNGKVKDEIIEAFTAAGYIVAQPRVLTAADFGVPQIRKRVFFLGIRNDLAQMPLQYPVSTHANRAVCNRQNGFAPYITVGDALSDLPEAVVESTGIDAGEPVNYCSRPRNSYQQTIRGTENEVYNHHTKRLLDTRMERITRLTEGATKITLPQEFQAGGHENKYRRLSSNEPSPTLTAHMSKDLSDFIHPRYNRPITVREAARIQSFPDSYVFVGSEFQQLKQIGNAVPPLLGAAVARAVIQQLDYILAHQRQNQPVAYL